MIFPENPTRIVGGMFMPPQQTPIFSLSPAERAVHPPRMPSVHPSALISADAELADDVSVGPFTVIDGPVKLEAGVRIAGHCHITGRVRVGAGSTVGWGAVIGADPQDLSFDPATESGVDIAERNTIREYVTIHRGSKPGSHTSLGAGNFLMTCAHLGHDAKLGCDNIIANNVMLAGHVTVGDRAFLGGGCAFHQFVRVGDLSITQGNAALSQDVPPYCIVHGVNLLSGLNVVGLRRAGFDSAARAEIKEAYHLLFLSRHPLRNLKEIAAARPWSDAARKLVDAVATPSRKGVVTR